MYLKCVHTFFIIYCTVLVCFVDWWIEFDQKKKKYLHHTNWINLIRLLFNLIFFVIFFSILISIFKFRLDNSLLIVWLASNFFQYLRIIHRSLISSWTSWNIPKKCNSGRRTKCYISMPNRCRVDVLSVSENTTHFTQSILFRNIFICSNLNLPREIVLLDYLRLSRHDFDEQTI